MLPCLEESDVKWEDPGNGGVFVACVHVCLKQEIFEYICFKGILISTYV